MYLSESVSLPLCVSLQVRLPKRDDSPLSYGVEKETEPSSTLKKRGASTKKEAKTEGKAEGKAEKQEKRVFNVTATPRSHTRH